MNKNIYITIFDYEIPYTYCISTYVEYFHRILIVSRFNDINDFLNKEFKFVYSFIKTKVLFLIS